MNSRQNNGKIALFSALMLVLLYGSSFLVELPQVEYPFSPLTSSLISEETFGKGISFILAALALLLTSFIAGPSVATTYMAMAAISPLAIAITPVHCAVLALAISIMFITRPPDRKNTIGNAFATTISLGIASLFFVPLVWLFPLFLIMIFSDTEEKGKVAVASLFGLFLPVAIIIGIAFIKDNNQALSIFSKEFGVLFSSVPRHFSIKLLTLLRIIQTIGLALAAAVSVKRRIDRFTVHEYRLYTRIMMIAIALSIVCLIYLCSPSDPYGIVISLPLSLLLCEYFTGGELSSTEKTATVTLILTIIAERITFLI